MVMPLPTLLSIVDQVICTDFNYSKILQHSMVLWIMVRKSMEPRQSERRSTEVGCIYFLQASRFSQCQENFRRLSLAPLSIGVLGPKVTLASKVAPRVLLRVLCGSPFRAVCYGNPSSRPKKLHRPYFRPAATVA